MLLLFFVFFQFKLRYLIVVVVVVVVVAAVVVAVVVVDDFVFTYISAMTIEPIRMTMLNFCLISLAPLPTIVRNTLQHVKLLHVQYKYMESTRNVKIKQRSSKHKKEENSEQKPMNNL